jgi:hypothetical protein
MDETEIKLIAEQLKGMITSLRGEIKTVAVEQAHQSEFNNHRIKELEEQVKDHETRIRSATDGVTQFKVWSGLATGGSWLISAMALIRTWFGG